MTFIGDRAVVLGGSIAGIFAARVLADRYREVVVVDRDRFPTAGRHRTGVPQDRHIHALQTRGKRVIDRLFPGAAEEMVAGGAVAGELGRDATMCFSGNRLCQVDADLDLLATSRSFLEGHLRDRLTALDAVRFLEGHAVRGLVPGQEGGAVAGVRVSDGPTSLVTLPADLVVDATGRGSRLPQWLEELGYAAPRSDETGLEVAYTTARYPRLPSDDRKMILVSATAPHGRRGGGAIAIEDHQWMVTMGGVLGETAPTDVPGFVAYAATLDIPDLHELIRDREPSSEPTLMRYPTARRRWYERLDRFPDRLVVLGDALCSFNPVYGQGMSVAGVEALALAGCLDEGIDGLATRFFRAIAPVVDDAWEMAASADARYVADGAKAPLPTRLVGRYQRRLLAAAVHDRVVSRAFREVTAMTSRPGSLMRPRVAWRVLRGRWRAERDATPAVAATADAR